MLSILLVLSSVVGQEPTSTKVEGTFTIPQAVPSFKDHLVEIRLYQFDPRIADKGADLVDKLQLKKFSHAQGKDTKKQFVLGKKGKLDPRKGYYVTFFVLKDGKRTHIGECQHKKGLCSVLTRGQPNKIKMTIRPVRK